MIPRDNKELVNYLKIKGALKTPVIIEAFETMDRAFFVPKQLKEMAYLDRPLPIGPGTTISQPFTVAFMLELLKPNKGQRVLDVGAGSGWSTAMLAQIIGNEGSVIGTELSPNLVDNANTQLQKLGLPFAKVELAERELGKPGHKFNRILVSAAAKERVPQTLLEQLEIGAKMVIPVDDRIVLVEHPDENTFKESEWKGFAFVPLR